MGEHPGATEGHALRGPIDRAVLLSIRDVIIEQEPLATAALDDFLDPRVLAVQLDDGLGQADTARIDIQWTTRDDYSCHYTDSADVDLRWDRHPHDGEYSNAPGLEHYHPPPAASSDPAAVEASCITQSTPTLVARAILKLWRTAYREESLDCLNAGSNPP